MDTPTKLLCTLLLGLASGDDDVLAGFDTILVEDLQEHLLHVAAPHNEGRDSPSAGLTRTGDYAIEVFEQAGLKGLARDGGYRLPFTGRYRVPDRAACALGIADGDGKRSFELDEEFVPLPGCEGEGEGEVVFLGFGIGGARGYDDLGKRRYDGHVAVILSGEPRHRRLLDGPEVTEHANVYAKVAELADRGCVAVVVVRRAPPALPGPDGEPLPPPALGYRYTWAGWNPATVKPMPPVPREADIPVVEVTEAVGSRLVGADVAALAAEIDESGDPRRIDREGVRARVRTGFRIDEVPLHNVAAVLAGTDPALSKEYVVLGAHYDHVGVDPLGRIGYGADDNGSGTVAVLELAQAFAASPPRRSVIFALFAAEEDGLLGSDAFADAPPVPLASIVAMLNMDMVGRGRDTEVVVLGVKENPTLGKVLKRARKLHDTKVKRVVTNKAQHLWQRSDHYSFHKRDVPVLFFFEAPSEADNRDYHTFRDTIEGVSLEKIARTTRLVFNTAWLIANDDERPPAPR